MNIIDITEGRWSTGDVLVADYNIKRDNMVIVKKGFGKGQYYLSGTFARQFPTEEIPRKKGGVTIVRVIPLTEMQKEVMI